MMFSAEDPQIQIDGGNDVRHRPAVNVVGPCLHQPACRKALVPTLRTVVIICRKYPPPDRAFYDRGKTLNVFICAPAMFL